MTSILHETSWWPTSPPPDQPEVHPEILASRSYERDFDSVEKPRVFGDSEANARRDRHGVGRCASVIHDRRVVGCDPNGEFLEVTQVVKG
jgi:hypothetical protein